MNQKDIDQFYELETSLHRHEVRTSSSAVSKLLADDFVEFGSSGRVFNKPSIINSLKSEKEDLKIKVTDFKAEYLAENIVLVTYRSNTSLRSSIWKLINGQWQMIFHQGTKTQ
jgi:hypothetical protein